MGRRGVLTGVPRPHGGTTHMPKRVDDGAMDNHPAECTCVDCAARHLAKMGIGQEHIGTDYLEAFSGKPEPTGSAW